MNKYAFFLEVKCIVFSFENYSVSLISYTEYVVDRLGTISYFDRKKTSCPVCTTLPAMAYDVEIWG